MGAVLVGDLGLGEHGDEVVLRARGGRSTIGARISATFGGSREALPDVEGLGDVDAEAAGDGEDRDGGAEVDVQLGPAWSTKESISRWTVSSIHLAIHHCALAGTNDGWTERPVATMLGAAHRQHASTIVEPARSTSTAPATRRTRRGCGGPRRRRRRRTPRSAGGPGSGRPCQNRSAR